MKFNSTSMDFTIDIDCNCSLFNNYCPLVLFTEKAINAGKVYIFYLATCKFTIIVFNLI